MGAGIPEPWSLHPGWHQFTAGPQASCLHFWASVSPSGTRKSRAGTFLRSVPAPTGHDQFHNKLVAEKPWWFHSWSFSKTEASSGKRAVSIPCRAAAKASPHLCPIFLLACRTPRGMEGSGTRNGVSAPSATSIITVEE